MANAIPDEAFARVANEMGAATFVQLETAKQVQKERAARGLLVSLPDLLVEQGILTPAMRENIEKKVQAQQAGGIQRLGQYKLLKKLGEGGMGAVYLAEDTAMGRQVALKVLPKSKAGNANFLSRFHRESRVAAQLNHVNIVAAHTVGEELGLHFLVMEYCAGEPLDRMLKTQQRLPWEKALGIVMQVARGLKHAHDQGILHRDIKPANIIVTPEGVAKILDLGLSKQLGDSEESFNTQTGMAVGTPHYISPEQARGDKSVDCRTDIYSLGATLYHLVTGQTPFHGSTGAAIMLKHLNEQLTNPHDLVADLPDGVAHVIMRMMAKEPADRYRDCAELLLDLELVIDGHAPSSDAIEAVKSSVAVATRPATRATAKTGGRTISLPSQRAAVASAHKPAGVPGQVRGGQQVAAAAPGHRAGRPNAADEGQQGAEAGGRKRLIVGAAAGAGVVAVLLVIVAAVLLGRARQPGRGGAVVEIKKETKAAPPLSEEQRKAEELRQAEEARLKDAAAKLAAEQEKKTADDAAKVAPPAKTETPEKKPEPPTKNDTAKKDTASQPDPAVVAAAAAEQRAARAQELFRAVLKGTAPLLKENKFAEATALLDQKLKDPAQADAAELLKQEKADIEAIQELRKAAVEALRKLAGKEVTLTKGGTAFKGKVVNTPKEGAVALDMGGAQVTFSALQLSVEDVDRYAPPSENPGEDLRRRGVLYLAAGSAAKAKAKAKACFAKPETLNARPYLDRITESEVGAVEAAALRAWERAEQLFAARDMKGAKAAYEAFERNHEKTQTAASKAATLKERYDAIEKAIGPSPTLTLNLGGGVKMEFVLIRAGKFLMGSPETEHEGRKEEGPQHEVTITKPFYLGKYEVTQEQYETVMGKNPSKFKDGADAPKRPVEQVSWDDALGFCEKLRAKTGKPVRLPTEAEREYACRAGTKTRYYSGDADSGLDDVAWSKSNSDGKSHPVGQKKPNAWGLYDMHGNVWEYCQDWYADKYEAGAVVDPQGPDKGNARVLRGGSWGYDPGHCRSAGRDWNDPDYRSNYGGFRVVAVAPRAP